MKKKPILVNGQISLGEAVTAGVSKVCFIMWISFKVLLNTKKNEMQWKRN